MAAATNAAKKAAKKKPAATKSSSKVAKKRANAVSRKKKLAKPAARPAKGGTKRAVKKRPAAIGRVKVPVDARLDLVFQKDYQAREIFDFLKVQTIRELEQFGPKEIIDRLTGPMVQTVERIRKTLAIVNRHLAHDEKFAKAFLAEVKKAL